MPWGPRMRLLILRTKPVADDSSESRDFGLKRSLALSDLIALGIGGSSPVIFIIIGEVLGRHAGASGLFAITISLVATLAAALCYAEFASLIPVSRSAYTYTYASLGEVAAVLVGWTLL